MATSVLVSSVVLLFVIISCIVDGTGGSSNSECRDALLPSFLRNASIPLGHRLYANTVGRVAHCPDIQPRYFSVGGGTTVFQFLDAPPPQLVDENLSSLDNVTCGMDCSVYAIPDTSTSALVTPQATSPPTYSVAPDLSYTSWKCYLNIPSNSTGDDDDALGTVCVAYLRYNASYWVNRTTYMVPKNMTLELDASTTFLSIWSSMPLMLWMPHVARCPWYFNISYDASKVVFAGVATVVGPSSEYFQLAVNCYCDDDHRSNATTGNNTGGTLLVPRMMCTTSSLFYWDELGENYFESPRSEFRVTDIVFLPGGQSHGSTVAPSSANVTIVALMDIAASRWQPIYNYSDPSYATASQRCYRTIPMAKDGVTPTVIPTSLVSCSSRYDGFNTVVDGDMVCCERWVGGNPANTQPLRSNVTVLINNDIWINDGEGIDRTTSTTPITFAPPRVSSAPGRPPFPSDNGTGGNSSEDPSVASPSPASPSTSSDASNNQHDEGAAFLLGMILIGLCSTVALIATVYFLYWRPRLRAREALPSVKIELDDSGNEDHLIHIEDRQVTTADERLTTPTLLSGLEAAEDLLLMPSDVKEDDNATAKDSSELL